MYEDLILDLIQKVKLFGYHFASLDLRQDSRIHEGGVCGDYQSSNGNRSPLKTCLLKPYAELSLEEKYEVLIGLKGSVSSSWFDADSITAQTIDSIYVMKQIQAENGELGANRYIISNCQSLEHLLQLYALVRMCDWEHPTVDFIPLFETIDDLNAAPQIMSEFYSIIEYAAHLETRRNKQTIMLGFSDGTKDGGYLMANWGNL